MSSSTGFSKKGTACEFSHGRIIPTSQFIHNAQVSQSTKVDPVQQGTIYPAYPAYPAYYAYPAPYPPPAQYANNAYPATYRNFNSPINPIHHHPLTTSYASSPYGHYINQSTPTSYSAPTQSVLFPQGNVTFIPYAARAQQQYPHTLPKLEVQELTEVVAEADLAKVLVTTLFPTEEMHEIRVPHFARIQDIKEIVLRENLIKDIPPGILEDGQTTISASKFILVDENNQIATWKPKTIFKVVLHLLSKGIFSYNVRDFQVVDNKLQESRFVPENPYKELHNKLVHSQVTQVIFVDANVVVWNLRELVELARNKQKLLVVTETVVKEYSSKGNVNLRKGGVFVLESKLQPKRGEMLFSIFYDQFMAGLPSKHKFVYPSTARDYEARHINLYENDMYDFLLFTEANFVVSQYKVYHPDTEVDFCIMTNDPKMLNLYNNEKGLFAREHLNVTSIIPIIPATDMAIM